jgi:hypothetical protein
MLSRYAKVKLINVQFTSILQTLHDTSTFSDFEYELFTTVP